MRSISLSSSLNKCQPFACAVQMLKIVRPSKICECDGYINNPNKHQLIANWIVKFPVFLTSIAVWIEICFSVSLRCCFFLRFIWRDYFQFCCQPNQSIYHFCYFECRHWMKCIAAIRSWMNCVQCELYVPYTIHYDYH